MIFTLEIEGGNFDFELDEHGMVWFIENDDNLGVIRTGYGHKPTRDREVAENYAKQFLYARRLIKEI